MRQTAAFVIALLVGTISTTETTTSSWKTYLDCADGKGVWGPEVEFGKGQFIKGIGQGIERVDGDDKIGQLFGALTTDKYQRNLVLNVISDTDKNELLFKLTCDDDEFIQDTQVKLDKKGELENIAYKCKNPSTGYAYWLSPIEDTDELGTWQEDTSKDPYYFCGVKLKIGNDTADHRIKGISFKSCQFLAVQSVSVEYSLSEPTVVFGTETIHTETLTNSENAEVEQEFEKELVHDFYEIWEIGTNTFTNDYIGVLNSVDYDSEAATYYTYEDFYENWTFNANQTFEGSLELSEDVTLPACTDLTYTFSLNTSYVSIPFTAVIQYTDGTNETYSGIYKTNFIVEEYLVSSVQSANAACSTVTVEATTDLVAATVLNQEIIAEAPQTNSNMIYIFASIIIAFAALYFLYSRKQKSSQSLIESSGYSTLVRNNLL